MTTDLVDSARDANERREWATAVDAFAEAEAEADGGALAADDHVAWGMALYWLRDVDGAIARLETAADRAKAEGTPATEARALQAALTLASWAQRDAVVAICAARLSTLLEDSDEMEGHALWQWALARMAMEQDLEEGTRLLEDALAIALRVGSPAAESLALMSLSQVDTIHCRVDEAMRKADAAAALALGADVPDLVAGGVLCGIVWSCRNVGDWERATQWTDVASRWAERTKVSLYPGVCQFHRCEILRVRGDLSGAEAHAEAACEELGALAPGDQLGYGYRELGLIRLIRGDADGARTAFRLAVQEGVDPNPGLAMLRLRNGDAASARRELEDALEVGDGLAYETPFLLPVLVTSCLAEGDVDAAADFAARLDELAARFGTTSHRGAAAQARAEVALARGEPDEARRAATAAWRHWRAVPAPYEAARARETLARVARASGLVEEAAFELEAARASYAQVGAAPDIDRIDEALTRLESAPATAAPSRAFMFTDIVDSTRLQKAMGDDRWTTLLDWHDRSLRGAFAAHDGEVVKHEGDGFFVVFPTGQDALRAGCRIQRELERHRADAGFAPEVRIGVHEGTAMARDGDWIGMSVTLAARVANEGDGGEVVCTDAVLASVPGAEVVESRSIEPKGVDELITIHRIAACV